MKLFRNDLEGEFLFRPNRFTVVVGASSGQITAHCPNSGSMMGLKEPGNKVYVWDSKNEKRKLRYTWELVEVNNHLVGINTNRPNTLVKEAIKKTMAFYIDKKQ